MTKHAGGRPLKFKTPEEITEKAQAYFETTLGNNLPITITGLALALNTTRETLMDYQERDEFSDTIKAVKLVCENYAEIQVFTGKNQAGAIFALKNYGWKDKQEYDHTSKGEKITYTDDQINAIIKRHNSSSQD
jgi:hypothetical protein